MSLQGSTYQGNDVSVGGHALAIGEISVNAALPDAERLASSDAQQIEARLDLQRALAVLAPEEQRLLLAYYSDDATDRAAIARQLQLTPGALRVKVFRLTTRLRAQLLELRSISADVDVELKQALARLESVSAALTGLVTETKNYSEMLNRHRAWADAAGPDQQDVRRVSRGLDAVSGQT